MQKIANLISSQKRKRTEKERKKINSHTERTTTANGKNHNLKTSSLLPGHIIVSGSGHNVEGGGKTEVSVFYEKTQGENYRTENANIG